MASAEQRAVPQSHSFGVAVLCLDAQNHYPVLPVIVHGASPWMGNAHG